jgi:hypothetical protein
MASKYGDGEKPTIAVAGYNFRKNNGKPSSAYDQIIEGPSMTRQEFADECDINTIMAQYDRYLADPMRSLRGEPQYVDFTEMPLTLMDAMEVLHRGTAAFMTLPAKVRREFDNDAAAFVDFASDPANIDQLRDWGLAAPLPDPPPVEQPRPPVPPAPADEAAEPPASKSKPAKS